MLERLDTPRILQAGELLPAEPSAFEFSEVTRGQRIETGSVLSEDLNSSVIYKELKDSERVREFIAFAKALTPYLSEEEQLSFLRNPISFTSQKMLFRGLEPEKYKNVIQTGEFPVYSGDIAAGNGVAVSNCPYSAFTYQKQGTLALFDRDSVIFKSSEGIVEAGSQEYKELVANRLNSLPEDQRRVAVYTVDESWDLSFGTKSNNPDDRVIMLRTPQPINTVKTFLQWQNGSFVANNQLAIAA